MLKIYCLSLLLQSSKLIYIDIFLQTKPYYEKYGEANSIADIFFAQSLFEVGFIAAVTTLYLTSDICLRIDPKGYLVNIVYFLIFFRELKSVMRNAHLMGCWKPVEKYNIIFPIFHFFY